MSGAGVAMPLPFPALSGECEEEQLAVMCTASQGLSSLAEPEGSKASVPEELISARVLNSGERACNTSKIWRDACTSPNT